jgi:diphosphomevalonate decarboxylase
VTVTVQTSPSLALVKYWGKLPGGINLPATSSLAVGLEELRTTTTVTIKRGKGLQDTVTVDGKEQHLERYQVILNHFRTLRPETGPLDIRSKNSFPTAAGVASSSSGFAALAVALDALLETQLEPLELSGVARLGSGSGARAVFGGFTTMLRGAEHATPFLPDDHWPELRILIALVETGRKLIGSREAMELSRKTSPLFDAWVELSLRLFHEGCKALKSKDLDRLGWIMRRSYLAMFGTMLSSDPPVTYWRPESILVQDICTDMRKNGTPVWETMDAGPQVKILTTEKEVGQLRARIESEAPSVAIIESAPGGTPTVTRAE